MLLYIDSVCIDSYCVNPCDQTQWNWPRECTLGKQKYQESNNRYINLHFPMKNVIISDDILDFYPDSIWIAIELSLSGNSWNDNVTTVSCLGMTTSLPVLIDFFKCPGLPIFFSICCLLPSAMQSLTRKHFIRFPKCILWTFYIICNAESIVKMS